MVALGQDSIVVLRALKELSQAVETLKEEVHSLRNSISHMELNMTIHLPDDSDTESETTEGDEAAISND